MTKRRSAIRPKAQARREGAVFIEALIVIGLIIVCMQCIWGMYRYCLFQHRAKVEARQLAWESSLKGCQDPDMNGALSSLSKSSGSEVDGLQPNSIEAPGWMQIGRGEPASVTLDLPEEVLGSTSVGAKEQFACNEKGGKKPLQLLGGGPDTNSTIQDATTTPD